MLIESLEFGKQRFQPVERPGIRAVGKGACRVGMGFHEETGDTDRDGAAREDGDIFALPPR